MIELSVAATDLYRPALDVNGKKTLAGQFRTDVKGKWSFKIHNSEKELWATPGLVPALQANFSGRDQLSKEEVRRLMAVAKRDDIHEGVHPHKLISGILYEEITGRGLAYTPNQLQFYPLIPGHLDFKDIEEGFAAYIAGNGPNWLTRNFGQLKATPMLLERKQLIEKISQTLVQIDLYVQAHQL